MKKINLRDLLSKKWILPVSVVSILLVIGLISLFKLKATASQNEEVNYIYTDAAEQKLANDVIEYLGQNITLPTNTERHLANEAVKNYRSVITSYTDVITDEITRAIQNRMRNSMSELLTETDIILSDEEYDALSAGMTEIIWKAVLEALKSVITEDNGANYELLIQSLQSQIEELQNQKTKISINANISDASGINLEDFSDEDLKVLAEKMGVTSYDELKNILNSADKETIRELEKEINELRKELNQQIKDSSYRQNNNAKDGRDGRDGKNGENGKNGTNGKTTYIAYADDKSGTNFSLTPTETSKYVGTCITDKSTQPTDAASYSNWQEYRAYVITATTDEDGVTTVHIN